MDGNFNYLQALFLRWLNNDLTEPEEADLKALLASAEGNTEIVPLLEMAWKKADQAEVNIQMDVKAVAERILRNDKTAGPLTANQLSADNDLPSVPYSQPQAHRVHFLKTAWFRYAAIVLLLAGTAIYLYTSTPSFRKSPEVVVNQPDIAPGGNRAILTLSDGSTITLDSALNGALAQQGNTKILKPDAGSLAYHAGPATGETLYNTVATPKGGQYQITLPDGTKVWLNAASSIRFPTAFTAEERKVEVHGEAYFEVAKNTKAPFRVRLNNLTEIEVLGTHFNVNAYSNEKTWNTTLLEGSVSVTKGMHKVVIKPGQQAQAGETIKVVNDVDIEKVVAWKNGLFNFEGASLEEVLRQLERWYDIEVEYEKNVPSIRFFGKMAKDIPLSDLLTILERSKIHFRVEGRKLIVFP